MEPQAGESRVGRQFAAFTDQGAVVEEGLRKPDALLVGVGELVDRDRLPEQVSGVEEHRAEGQVLGRPQGALRHEADVAVLVVAEVLHPAGQRFLVGGGIGLAGKLLGLGLDFLEGDILAFPDLGGKGPGQHQKGCQTGDTVNHKPAHIRCRGTVNPRDGVLLQDSRKFAVGAG